MTPFELSIYIKAFTEKEKERSKQIIIQAYYTEAFARQKKLPDIDKLFKEDKPKKQQNSKAMLEEIKKINAMFGGEVIGSS